MNTTRAILKCELLVVSLSTNGPDSSLKMSNLFTWMYIILVHVEWQVVIYCTMTLNMKLI